MQTLADERPARWLDALDYGLLSEAQTMLGDGWANPAARRAVLHYLRDVRAAREGRPNESRSTAGEWRERITRLIRFVEGKDCEAHRRDRPTLHPTIRLPSPTLELTAA